MNQSIPPKLIEIQSWLRERSHPAFRFRQIEQAWTTETSWNNVSTLSSALRSDLTKQFEWLSVAEQKVLTSKIDGTQKTILKLSDGAAIETVLMPNAREKKTICLSTQVGCGMGCVFCATGTMGFKRNLSADEIIDQVRYWLNHAKRSEISNLVLMGMGEPLANYDAVALSLHWLISKMKFGPTTITLSTVGFRPGLKRLLDDETFPAVRVALSLHAATDEVRGKIVPTHRATSLAILAEAVETYLKRKGNRRHHFSLEYVMLDGVNDREEDAKALVRRFGRFGARLRLNLIPWNPTTADLSRSPSQRLLAFQTICKAGGIPTTIRISKGLDIGAACGQLITNISQK